MAHEFIKAGGDEDDHPVETTGAITLESPVVNMQPAGAAEAYTLADGAEGQVLTLVQTAKPGSETAVVTPDNLYGGTTITLDAIGDTAVLRFVSGSWALLGGNGVAIA